MLHKTGAEIISTPASISRLLVFIYLFLLIFCHSIFAETTDHVLAKANIIDNLSRVPFPIYAHLQGASGEDYALVIAHQSELSRSGIAYKILETIPEDMQKILFLPTPLLQF